jgi:hypothetical protein
METILSAILGPFGSLVILAVILYGIYRMANDKAWPIVDKYVNNVDNNMKAILAEHKADREVFRDSISSLAMGQDRIVIRIDELSEKVEEITDKIGKHEKILEKQI